jgi:hypothetical protein
MAQHSARPFCCERSSARFRHTPRTRTGDRDGTMMWSLGASKHTTHIVSSASGCGTGAAGCTPS